MKQENSQRENELRKEVVTILVDCRYKDTTPTVTTEEYADKIIELVRQEERQRLLKEVLKKIDKWEKELLTDDDGYCSVNRDDIKELKSSLKEKQE